MKAPRSICRGRVDGKIKEGSDSAGSNRVFGDTDRDTIAETGKPQPWFVYPRFRSAIPAVGVKP